MANLSQQMRKTQNNGQSNSLWNISLSPGWSTLEMNLLKMGVMKFGIGRWTALEKSKVLPTKQIMACYLQLQRLMGQQSLAGFMGLHVDIDRVKSDNEALIKKGRKIKYGCVLVNEGDKLTKSQKLHLIEQNKQKYGLSDEYIKYLDLPKASDIKVYDINKILNSRKKLSTSEKIEHLLQIKKNLEKKLYYINKGIKIQEFNYKSPKDWEEEQLKKKNEKKKNDFDDKDVEQQIRPSLNIQTSIIRYSDVDEDQKMPDTINHEQTIQKISKKKENIVKIDQNSKKIKKVQEQKILKMKNQNSSKPISKLKKKSKKLITAKSQDISLQDTQSSTIQKGNGTQDAKSIQDKKKQKRIIHEDDEE